MFYVDFKWQKYTDDNRPKDNTWVVINHANGSGIPRVGKYVDGSFEQYYDSDILGWFPLPE